MSTPFHSCILLTRQRFLLLCFFFSLGGWQQIILSHGSVNKPTMTKCRDSLVLGTVYTAVFTHGKNKFACM